MKKLHLVLVFTSIAIIIIISGISCLDNDPLKTKNADPNAFYFEYRISGAEEEENVIVYAQILRWRAGPAVSLASPSKILLDGEEMNVDSANLTGSYYELQKPLSAFAGIHVITFISPHNQEYKEEFDFKPFRLKTKIPLEVTRSDLSFDFSGLDKLDLLRVVATDTSFSSNDINQFDTVRNGRLTIQEWRLDNLENGHINLLFSKELERPVKNGTKGGGRIAISYELRREFILKE
jgi:hypothetical protein